MVVGDSEDRDSPLSNSEPLTGPGPPCRVSTAQSETTGKPPSLVTASHLFWVKDIDDEMDTSIQPELFPPNPSASG